MNHVKVTGIEVNTDLYESDPEAETARINTLMAVGADVQRERLSDLPLAAALALTTLSSMFNVGQTAILQRNIDPEQTIHEGQHAGQLLAGLGTGWDTDTGHFIITVMMHEGVNVQLRLEVDDIEVPEDGAEWLRHLEDDLDGYAFYNTTDAIHAALAGEKAGEVVIPEDVSALEDVDVSDEFEVGFTPDDDSDVGFQPE